MTDVTPIPKKKRRPKPSTDRDVATRLHSKIIRAVGYCEWTRDVADGSECSGRLECCHIIRRAWRATRTDLDNAVCLCAAHHRRIDTSAVDMIRLVGADEYRRLEVKAKTGIQGTAAAFWRSERARLTEIARSMGVK